MAGRLSAGCYVGGALIDAFAFRMQTIRGALLGQDQLVVAGQAQAVFLAGVGDEQFTTAFKQKLAIDARTAFK